MMRQLLFILLILTSALSMLAGTIEGRVIEKNGESIAGANCICFSLPDSTCNNFAITDDHGYFKLNEPDADWYVVIDCIGYDSSSISKSEYSKLREDGKPASIVLNPSASELREVVVNGPKGAMTMKNGIISFNNLNEIRENRVLSSAHDLLLALPLISSMDGDNIRLAGAPLGNVVYINGKQLQMDGAALIDYLKTIPPEMVEGVEVIYTPSPKWKTRSSVINVKIKRQSAYSFNGLVKASGTWKHYFKGSPGASIFVGLPKLNINAGYSFNSGKGIKKEVLLGRHTVGTNVTEVKNTDVSKTLANSHNVYTLFDYEINKTNSLSINYSGQFSPKKINEMSSDNSIFGYYDSKVRSDYYFNAISAVYSNKKGIDVGLDYSHYSASRYQDIVNNDIPDDLALTGESYQTVNRVKAYIDMTTNLSRDWSLLYGAAYEFTKNNNWLTNISNDPDMISDNVKTKTEEQIATAYIGAQKSLFKGKLSVSANLKGEIYSLESYKTKQLLPTATITYIPSYTHIFQASFRSYKRYPSLWQRQDYKSYSNPYQLSEGNPTLKPATYNMTTLLYLFKQKYTLTLSYYPVSNFFLTQSFQSDDALVLVSKPYNIDSKGADVTITIPVNIGKWFMSNILVYAGAERFKSSDWHNISIDKSRFGATVMIENTFTISQKPKISINLTGMYKQPCLAGLWDRGHAWLLNAGFSGAFLNNNLTVSLTGFDLLQTLYPVEQLRLGNQWMDLDYNYYSRYFNLNITFKFKGYKNKDPKTYDTSRYGFE